MKKLFKDRKTLYLVLGLVMVSVFTLTIAYAALNTVLKITGNAEVSSAEWDIRLENPVVTSGSVNTNLPVISGNKEASFSATLNNPGEFYEFSIDVVNNGSIDAMIDSITKSPTLSETQAKYLNYIVEYQNGESINTKQLVQANSFVRLKVRVEFKKDINSTDLPNTTEELNLSFIVKYTQADESGSSVTDNGVKKKLINVVSGDGTNTSDEVCIGEECFYVISSKDEEIIMLSKMNITLDDSPIQSSSSGTKAFSSTNYWSSTTSTYPAYVYNENSYLYEYVENYKNYLEGLGASINEARLITMEELEGLGCVRSNSSCSGAPSWVYSITYWSGAALSSSKMWSVFNNGGFGSYGYTGYTYGVRPVIVIDIALI